MRSLNQLTVNLNTLIEASFTMLVVTLYLFSNNSSNLIIFKLVLLLFSAFAILKILICKKLYLHAYLWPALAFVLLCFLSVFWAKDYSYAASSCSTLAQILMLYILIYHSFYDTQRLDVIIRALFIAGLCLTAYSFMVYGWTGIISALFLGKRIGSEISQINVYGMYCALTVVLSFYYYIFKRRILFLLFAVFPFMMAMASGSRKAVLIIILGIFLLIAFKNGVKKLYRSVLFIALGGVALYFLFQLPLFSAVNARMEEMFAALLGTGSGDSSAESRMQFIQMGLAWFKNRPLLGFGINNFRYLNGMETGSYMYAHNNFIELLCDTGMVGFAIYYSMYVYILFHLLLRIREKDQVIMIVFLIMLITLIMDFGRVSYITKDNWVYLSLGFLACGKNMDKVISENKLKLLLPSKEKG